MEHPHPHHKKKHPMANIFLIVAAIHVAGLTALGGLVIFERLVPPKEQKFESVRVLAEPEPPPVIRPMVNPAENLDRLDLLKPQLADLPPVALPNLDLSLGEGQSSFTISGGGRGSGGLSISRGPDIRSLAVNIRNTEFGTTQFSDGMLKGTFYDTKLTPRSEPIPGAKGNSRRMIQIVHDFTSKGWNKDDLDFNFYSMPEPLYTDRIFVPSGGADRVPAAFNAPPIVEPTALLVLYEGTFTPPRSGEFRMVGHFDDILIVWMDGEIVFDGSLSNSYSPFDQTAYPPYGKSLMFKNGSRTGKYFTWTSGRAVSIKILIGETPGGSFGGLLTLEPKNSEELKLFFTRRLSSRDRSEFIEKYQRFQNLLP